MSQDIKIKDKDLVLEDGEYALWEAIRELSGKIEKLSQAMR